MDDKQKSKKYFNSHSSTIINRNGYWSYDYRITSKILMSRKVKNLIDIGCGNGAFLSMFNKVAPDVKLSGLDISGEMVAQSRRNSYVKKSITVSKEGNEPGIPWQGDFQAA